MIDVIIATADWSPERAAPLGRLVNCLHMTPAIFASKVKEHANVWARRIWESVALQDEHSEQTATVVLNDDVIPHPALLDHARALVRLLPGQVISLHGQIPGVADAHKAGARLATCYWPSGPGYILQRGHASALLRWLDSTPPDWFAGDVNEDGAVASWLWSRQTPAYVTIPALVRHDTTVPSTLGYDSHAFRSSAVDWAECKPGWTLADVERAPYVAVPWMSDVAFAALGQALRGAVPLCGFCKMQAAYVVNTKRGTGVCGGCAKAIKGAV